MTGSLPPPAAALLATADLARQVFEARREESGDPWEHPGVVIDPEDGLPRLARREDERDLRIAPESLGPLDDEEEGSRADAYRIGVVLHRSLTGALPLRGSNPIEWRLAHRHETPPAPSELDPDLPPGIDRLVAILLSKHPQERPESLTTLADGLEEQAVDLREQGRHRRSQRLTDLVLGPPRNTGAPANDAFPWALMALGLVIALGTVVRTLGPEPTSELRAEPTIESPAPPAAPTIEPAAPASGDEAALATEAPKAVAIDGPPSTAAPPEAAGHATAVAPPPPAAPPPARRPTTRALDRGPMPAIDRGTEPAELRRPSATPERSPSPPETGPLLAEAESLLARKQYLAPRGHNALALYRQVLQIEPDHAVARARVQLIRDTHRDLATTHATAGQLERAHAVLFALDQAMPGDPDIAAHLIEIEARIESETRPGWVELRVHPWGDVFVDGRYVDQTPMDPLELEAGRHRIEIRGEHGQSRSMQIEVKGGETEVVTIDLSERGRT